MNGELYEEDRRARCRMEGRVEGFERNRSVELKVRFLEFIGELEVFSNASKSCEA